MKSFVTAVLILAAPAFVLAQAAAPDVPAKPALTGNKAVRRSALKAVEEVTPIDDDKVNLTPGDLEIAKRVYVGSIPCELGASVTITPNEKRPGFFVVQVAKTRFSMHPVESRTGAIRLEDPRDGAMWLQLGNKSMLMSQKQGRRLADECQSSAQLAFADEMKKNPPVSILEPLPSAAAAAPIQPASAAN